MAGLDPAMTRKAVMTHGAFVFFALAVMSSKASAQLACAVTATPVQFDTIRGTETGTHDARGSITVTCTGSQGGSIAACVELGHGAGAGLPGQRVLSPPKGGHPLEVQIFQDPALKRPWGAVVMGQAAMLQRTGDGPMSATTYLRLYMPQRGSIPGSYTAQFPVTLRYGAVTGNAANCNALAAAAPWPNPHKAAAFPIPLRKR